MKLFTGTARCYLVAGLTALILGCSSTRPVDDIEGMPKVSTKQTYSYTQDIQPIFEQKCLACHGCYDSPCQLNLASADGLLRGSSKQKIYGLRLRETSPTRMFTDAETTLGWRQKGFYSVLNTRGGVAQNNLDHSLLYKMIELGKDHPLAPGTEVAENIELGLKRKDACPVPEEFEKYAREKPLQGMPLAISGLTDSEFQTLRQWIREGSVIDAQPFVANQGEQAQLLKWEEFFNRPALKNQLVARYLYEHLFAAHLHFEELTTGNFYELVRSATPSGSPLQLIATVRPNDDPKQHVYYRLRRVEGALVHKAHIPYPLSAAKMARFENLFLTTEWDVAKLPDYSSANSVNPFLTFEAIPARARYQFMLDSSEFFVMNFIRGPLCAGQIATEVIDDRFFVMFQDPNSDLSVTDSDYMEKIQPYLSVVANGERVIGLEHDWNSLKKDRNEYINLRGKNYRKQQPLGPSLDALWDGDGNNDNAVLTVLRNYDNAMVTKGFVGAVPKTIWVMDYPMLERTFYLLAANYNVFGTVASQTETRFYFDLIRTGGEDNFLHFMPPNARTSMRNSWYQGEKAQKKIRKSYEYVNEDLPVQITYKTDDPKAEFVTLVRERLQSLAGPMDVLNNCAESPCHRPEATATAQRVEASLQTLTSKPASLDNMRFIDFMTDVSFVRISTGDSKADLAYTLVRNKEQTNVAFMFGEAKRREHSKDTLTAYRGLIGSYPNYMFNVPLAEVETFTEALQAAGTREQFIEVVTKYGLSRSDPQIWTNFQWFVDYMRRTRPIDAGVYDLSRYKKIADLIANEEA